MNDLLERIKKYRSTLLLYGLTPPKAANSEEKNISITNLRIKRINTVPIDGLVVYDIHDEKDRSVLERPMDFLPTIPSIQYSNDYLAALNLSKIVYLCVGKYTGEELEIIFHNSWDKIFTLVGASSRNSAVKCSLVHAYEIFNRYMAKRNLLLGGVIIPERHIAKQDEHLRIIHKTENGCSFFITQCIFNVEYAKSLLSDYYYECEKRNTDMRPVFLTFTPCGHLKTIDFLEWLGIKIPVWIKNELKDNNNTLEKSIEIDIQNFKELSSFAKEKGIPIGVNIESVSIKKEEILASLELTHRIHELL